MKSRCFVICNYSSLEFICGGPLAAKLVLQESEERTSDTSDERDCESILWQGIQTVRVASLCNKGSYLFGCCQICRLVLGRYEKLMLLQGVGL